MIASQSSNKIYGYWLMQRLIVYLLVLRYIQSLQKNQANGNLTRKTELDDDGKTKTTAYSYDFENRLIKVEIKDEEKTKIVSFAYDPFGRRISKTVQYPSLRGEAEAISDDDDEKDEHDYEGPKTTYYVYDNEDIIAEYNSKGKITARYTHGLGIDEPMAVKKKDHTYYYHADGLGSITALTDEKGKTAQIYDYDSFGNLKNYVQKIKQPYTYTAREYDPETKLYYYRARYYDAKIGRFISEDPIGFAGGDINFFAYVGNNPVNAIDPLGLETYRCTKPLNALGGSGAKSGPDIWGNPAYHQYSCVVLSDGAYQCGGQDHEGSAWHGPGKPSNDDFRPDSCKQSQPDNDCFERCLINEWSKPRPTYGIPFGTDCQEYDNDVNQRCLKQCNSKK